MFQPVEPYRAIMTLLFLSRVPVKDGEGKLVDITQSVLNQSQQLENLAILVIHEIDNLPQKYEIFNHKYIKVSDNCKFINTSTI